MGTSGHGLLRYAGGTFDTLTTADGLPSDRIRAIHEDEHGVLWIGTEDAGLARIDLRDAMALRDRPITTYGTAEGLFDNVIHQILPDDEGRFWMSTNRGLFWVRRSDLDAVHTGAAPRVRSVAYTERDGLRNREANGGVDPAGLRDRSGRLWFPTQDGVALVAPSAATGNTIPPLATIERLTADSIDYAAPSATASLSLNAAARNFTIRYTAPSFVDPKSLRFRYRLDGFDRRWTEAGTRREAFYTNVPPGAYTFRVEAENEAGIRSPAPATVTLTVAPYIYETWLFRAACILLVVGAVVAGIGLRTRALRERQEQLQTAVAERPQEVQAANRAMQAKNEQLAHQAQRLQQQTEQLQALDAAKSRFFANVSHEFRTPLTLILGPTHDALQSGDRLSSDTVGLIHQNAKRLQRLINQLLDLSALDAGRLVLDRHTCDLRRDVRHAVQMMRPLAERSALSLAVDLPDTPVWASVDAERLGTVLSNLLSNAVKFTPEGGTVRIQLHHAPSGDDEAAAGVAVLTVADTGPGIPPEEHDRLFERFHQVDESASQRRGGSGIGLALANELVALHGGTIEVESTVGTGTTFTVRLPAQAASPGAPPQRPAPLENDLAPFAPAPSVAVPSVAVSATTGRTDAEATDTQRDEAEPAETDRPTVLVVDDHADLRRYVRSVLSGTFDVVDAADGAEGLAMAHEHLPDCIVTDVMMPGLSGFDMAQALQDDGLTEGIPLLFLTARATEADTIEGLSLGADAYLTKPFSAAILTARVEGLIAKRHRLRERLQEQSAATDAPPPPSGASSDASTAFLDNARAAIRRSMHDPAFGVSDLADAMGLSRSQLYRRLKKEANTSPSALIRHGRLAEARTLLRDETGTVTEVAYAVGFRSLSAFSRAFRDRYGIPPSDADAPDEVSAAVSADP